MPIYCKPKEKVPGFPPEPFYFQSLYLSSIYSRAFGPLYCNIRCEALCPSHLVQRIVQNPIQAFSLQCCNVFKGIAPGAILTEPALIQIHEHLNYSADVSQVHNDGGGGGQVLNYKKPLLQDATLNISAISISGSGIGFYSFALTGRETFPIM